MTKDELFKKIEENTMGPRCWSDIRAAVDAYSEALIAAKPHVMCSVCPDCAAYSKKEDTEFTICWNCGNTYRAN